MFFTGSATTYIYTLSLHELFRSYMKDSANYVYDGTNCTLSTPGYNDGGWHQAVFVVDTAGGRLYSSEAHTANLHSHGEVVCPTTTQQISLAASTAYLPATLDELH